MAGKKSHVRWTEDEVDTLADLAIALRVNDPYSSLLNLVQRANEQMPKARQRNVMSNVQIEEIGRRVGHRSRQVKVEHDELIRLRKELAALKESQGAGSPAVDMTDEELMAAFAPRVLSNMSLEDVLQHFDCNSILADTPTSVLIGEIARRMTEGFDGLQSFAPAVAQVAQAAQAIIPAAIPSGNGSAQAKVPQIDKIKSVAIIGIQDKQLSTLRRMVPGVLFKSIPRGQEIPKGSDLYVSWTRFLSHSEENRLRSAVPSSAHIRHNGGLKAMANSIMNRL